MKQFQFPTAVTLANAMELITGAVHELAPDVAKTAEGSQMSRSAVANLVASRLGARFARTRAIVKENKQ